MPSDLKDDLAALVDGAGAIWLERDVVRVAGADAEAFLQGQLSQDVAALAPGGSALSFLLQPQGRLEALVRVSRMGPDAYLLDTDGGFGPAVVARLTRFKLRTKADIEPLPWRGLGLRGAGGTAHPVPPPGGVAARAPWPPPFGGIDLLGPEVEVPDGVRLCSAQSGEALRILAGAPRMGAELDERTIPAETGLVDVAASFTKGCYTGQELVARMDARGSHAPRQLRAVTVLGAQPPVGADLVGSDGGIMGRLTSVAAVGEDVRALGFVKRDTQVPGAVTVRWDDGEAAARLEPLPDWP